MAVVNPVLMISGAETVKSSGQPSLAASNTPDNGESFASTLRKHLPTSRQTEPPVASQAVQSRQATQPHGSAPDAHAAAPARQAQADDQTATEASDVPPASDSPSPAASTTRKKAAANPGPDALQADAAMAPWMQNMLAMRSQHTPASPEHASPVAMAVAAPASALASADDVLQAIPVIATPALDVEGKPVLPATDLPPSIPVATDSAVDTTVDAGHRQVLGQILQALVPAATEAGANPVAETLQLATLASGQAPDASAFRDGMTLASGAADSTAVTLPLSVAMPAAPWANAAGLQANSPVVTGQIAVPFGQERWQAALNQQVMHMVGASDEVASLTLSPPDLGPIQVVLKVDNQSVNTSFVSDNPQVRQALEDGMQDLRLRMESQGLQLGQTFIGNGQQAQQHFAQTASAFAKSDTATDQVHGEVAATESTRVRTTPLGLVDTFV